MIPISTETLSRLFPPLGISEGASSQDIADLISKALTEIRMARQASQADPGTQAESVPSSPRAAVRPLATKPPIESSTVSSPKQASLEPVPVHIPPVVKPILPESTLRPTSPSPVEPSEPQKAKRVRRTKRRQCKVISEPTEQSSEPETTVELWDRCSNMLHDRMDQLVDMHRRLDEARRLQALQRLPA